METLNLDEASDDEEDIPSKLQVAYSAKCEFTLPVNIIQDMKTKEIVPRVVDTLREISEKHYLIKNTAAHL